MFSDDTPGAPKYDYPPRRGSNGEVDLNDYIVALYGFKDPKYSTNGDNFLTGHRKEGPNHYTNTIRNLVRECCKWQQSERPTLTEINAIATQELAKFSETDYADPHLAHLSKPGDLDTFEIGLDLDPAGLPYLPTPVQQQLPSDLR